MELNFVTKAKNTSRANEGDVTLTLRGKGEGRQPYMLGVILSESGHKLLNNPEYLTVAIVREKDHIRCYFKTTDKKEGFHGDKKGCRVYYTIPRVAKEDILEISGSYELKFSKAYNFYYVEKETLNFVERAK